MIKITKFKTYNWMNAIHGMRNPLESWSRIDSTEKDGVVDLGKNDLGLMLRLVKAGNEHRKFMRQIFVSFEITMPLYALKELDTYKIGVTSNSTSTMHCIHKKEFTEDDFTWPASMTLDRDWIRFTIDKLNEYRQKYLELKDERPLAAKQYWRVMIEMLPSGYNQTRMITCNYENLLNMVWQRRYHKLSDWREFCDYMLENAPYLKEFIEVLDKNSNEK